MSTKTNGKKATKTPPLSSANHWLMVLMEEFEKESDRASVILVAAMLDQALESLLRARLVSLSTRDDDLFDSPNAPLTTFSSRISMAYRIGLISRRFCRDLHLIRKIRNEFAHNIHGCTFESTGVRSRCDELARSSGLCKRNPEYRASHYEAGVRGDFLFSAAWMVHVLHREMDRVEPIEEHDIEWGYSNELSLDKMAEDAMSKDEASSSQ